MLASSDDAKAAADTADAAADQGACDGTAGLETASTAEIDRVIEEVIREHGANAAIEAATRTMSTLDEGAVKLRSLWQRVLEAAQEARQDSCGRTGASAGAHS